MYAQDSPKWAQSLMKPKHLIQQLVFFFLSIATSGVFPTFFIHMFSALPAESDSLIFVSVLSQLQPFWKQILFQS